MQEIIPAIPTEVLKSELTEKTFVRKANFGNRSIYIVDANNAPNVIQEIGRLREIAFRSAGGGSGLSVDLDEYDSGEFPFQQLIIWGEEEQQILGGYRFQLGEILAKNRDGHYDSPTAHLFKYNEKFVKDFLPSCVELGRSFIVPGKQSGSGERGSMYTLDNLWDGLGAIVVLYSQLKYFFGKVTMYPTYNKEARDCILYFLDKYCPDPDNLMTPYDPIQLETPIEDLKALFNADNFKLDYRTLSRQVRNRGEVIPPLVNAYMKLSPTMRSFGTAINHPFGAVEETGILITIDDIYKEQRERHIDMKRS